MTRDEYGRFVKGGEEDDDEKGSKVGRKLAEMGLGGAVGGAAGYGAHKGMPHAARGLERAEQELAKKGKSTLRKGMTTVSMTERAKAAKPWLKGSEAAGKGAGALKRLLKMSSGGKAAGIGAGIGAIAAALGGDEDED